MSDSVLEALRKHLLAKPIPGKTVLVVAGADPKPAIRLPDLSNYLAPPPKALAAVEAPETPIVSVPTGREVSVEEVAKYATNKMCCHGTGRMRRQRGNEVVESACSCAARRFLAAHPNVTVDPSGRAWWPLEGASVATPVASTALPVPETAALTETRTTQRKREHLASLRTQAETTEAALREADARVQAQEAPFTERVEAAQTAVKRLQATNTALRQTIEAQKQRLAALIDVDNDSSIVAMHAAINELHHRIAARRTAMRLEAQGLRGVVDQNQAALEANTADLTTAQGAFSLIEDQRVAAVKNVRSYAKRCRDHLEQLQARITRIAARIEPA